MTVPAMLTATNRCPSTVIMPTANMTSMAISVVSPESASFDFHSAKVPATTTAANATRAAATTSR